MQALLRIIKHALNVFNYAPIHTKITHAARTAKCVWLREWDVMIVIGRDGGANPAMAQSSEQQPTPSLIWSS